LIQPTAYVFTAHTRQRRVRAGFIVIQPEKRLAVLNCRLSADKVLRLPKQPQRPVALGRQRLRLSFRSPANADSLHLKRSLYTLCRASHDSTFLKLNCVITSNVSAPPIPLPACRRLAPLRRRLATPLPGSFSKLNGSRFGNWCSLLVVPEALKISCCPLGICKPPSLRARGFQNYCNFSCFIKKHEITRPAQISKSKLKSVILI